MRSLRCFLRAFGFHTALLTLAAAVPSAVASDPSSIGYLDVYCGAPPVWRPSERVVLPPHEFPVTVPISISGFAFNPSFVTINVGDTVMWTNNDPAPHTATSDSGVWDSGPLSQGQTFSFTFTGAGEFSYLCSIHPSMTGLIRVLGEPTPTPSRTPTPTPTPSPTPTPTPSPTPSPFPELDLTIGQSDSPDPVFTGHPLTYTLIVTNAPSALGGSACPTVRFGFPTGVPVVFRNASGTNGFVGTPDANGVTFSGGCLSSIGGPTTATLTVVLTPQAAGTLTSLGSHVIVDPENLVPESNENNNAAQTVTTTVTNAPTSFDFDGDHKADLSVFRPSVGEWYYQQSSTNITRGFGFGTSTDRVATADFTGDGKTDIAFWRPSTGNWFVLRSEDSTFFAFPFGSTGDIPAPADYDGDGRADAAVFRPSVSTWFILRSSGGVSSIPFGISSDVPVPADYDGDGKADVGIYRPGPGQWWNLRSSDGSVFAATFGSSTDKPVAGDYTGDGLADVAFYRPSEGTWYVLRSEDQSFYAFPFGANGDKPAPGDFDGDGKFDAAVFRPSDTNWYILKSTGGVLIQQFGAANDIPLPGAFVP